MVRSGLVYGRQTAPKDSFVPSVIIIIIIIIIIISFFSVSISRTLHSL